MDIFRGVLCAGFYCINIILYSLTSIYASYWLPYSVPHSVHLSFAINFIEINDVTFKMFY